MKVGVFVPSYLLPGEDAKHADQIRRFAMKAEELGFDSLFITDHLLTASVSGLVPNALYHVRLVAQNGSGTTFGPMDTL